MNKTQIEKIFNEYARLIYLSDNEPSIDLTRVLIEQEDKMAKCLTYF